MVIIMKRPELLAPSGNMESLKTAIAAGADAVYLGGILFGARSFAGNFNNEELKAAVKYAHLRNVKVYVTVNTIIYEHEVEKFIEYISFLYKNNVDALIMQDLGMIDLVRKKFPDFEIHASTQANIHNIHAINIMKKLNVKRVVLARELTYDEITNIRNNSDIELEVFIHGSLCISLSGECYMSTLIGPRSANRGTCSQCCRKNYSLLDNDKVLKEGYLLSFKDLMTIDNIPKLIELGIESFKIEGRMKRPEYVYFVVSMYRKAIDSYFEKKNYQFNDQKELNKIFNRGYTKGFLFTKDNFINAYRPNHIGIKIGKVVSRNKKDVLILLEDDLNYGDGLRILNKDDIGVLVNNFYIDNKLVKEAKKGQTIKIQIPKVEKGDIVYKTSDVKSLENINNLIILDKKIPINIDINLKDNGFYADIYFDNKKYTFKYLENFSKSINQPIKKEDITKNFNKIKDYVYVIENININYQEDLFIPISKLNEIRRELFENLDSQRLFRSERKETSYFIEVPNYSFDKKLVCEINQLSHFNLVKNKYDYIYVPYHFSLDGDNIYYKIPRFIKKYPIQEKVVAGEIGALDIYNNIISDFSFNVTNSYTVALLHSLGVEVVTLSYELTYKQVDNIIKSYHYRYKKHPNLEIITKGYLEAMITKYSFFKEYNNPKYLMDTFKNKYHLVDYPDYMVIYDYKKKNLKEDYYALGVNRIRHIYVLEDEK